MFSASSWETTPSLYNSCHFVFVSLACAQISLREDSLRAGLRELLIEIRCVDLGEQLVFLDVRADIHEPALYVAVDPRDR